MLTERLTGVPVAVIANDFIRGLGLSAGPLARWMLRGHRTKHWMRTWYALSSLRKLKAGLGKANGAGEYWQAGKSVSGITSVRPAAEIVQEFRSAWRARL